MNEFQNLKTFKKTTMKYHEGEYEAELNARAEAEVEAQQANNSVNEILERIYAAYGSGSGILFGIQEREIVKTIIEFVLHCKRLQHPYKTTPLPDNWKEHLWDKISTWQSREETRNDNSLYVRRSEQQKSEACYKEIEDYVESLIKQK